VNKSEFRRALRMLKIAGEDAEYDMLFDSWDESGNGSIEYTELLAAMHAGRR
jgi:Ca2+-binding EF-hand superfamily protein